MKRVYEINPMLCPKCGLSITHIFFNAEDAVYAEWLKTDLLFIFPSVSPRVLRVKIP